MTQEMLENDAFFRALRANQFESIDTQNFLAREARKFVVTSLGSKAPKILPNLVKSHENFV